MIEIEGVEVLGAEAQTHLAGPRAQRNSICASLLLETGEDVDAAQLVHRVKARIASTIDLVPRLRKVAIQLPGKEGIHVLADPPELDLDAHLQVNALDEVVSEERFRDLVLMFNDQPLDLDRPLWRAMIVPRIEGGLSGIAIRVHHFVQDGVLGAASAAILLIDDKPDRELRTPPPFEPAPPPTQEQLEQLSKDVAHTHHLEVTALVEGASGHPSRTVHHLRGIAATYRDELSDKPSQLLGRQSDLRGLDLVQVPIAQIKRCQESLGEHVSFNDVAVTAFAGGLSRMLDPDQRAGEELRVDVPITLSLRDKDAGFDSSASFMVLAVPLDEDDPHEILRAVNAQSTRRKGEEAESIERLMHALMLLPLSKFERASALAWSSGNLLFSDIPGPQQEMYVAGARLRTLLGVGNLRGASALRVVAASFGDQVSFGIVYDRTAIPIEKLKAGILETLDLLERPC